MDAVCGGGERGERGDEEEAAVDAVCGRIASVDDAKGVLSVVSGMPVVAEGILTEHLLVYV